MRIAVIITTYNRPDALALVLAAYADQHYSDLEVIVADDGSNETTKLTIESFQRRSGLPVKHVWQEDLGFRAAAVRNLALSISSAEYVIYTDGDCIPTGAFLSAHSALACRGRFVAGNRVLLSEKFTDQVLLNQLPVWHWSWQAWRKAKRQAWINRTAPLRALPNVFRWRDWISQSWKGAKTCNLGVWRDDLLRVNGFDERYVGWGLEDSDLVMRLLRAGVKRRDGRFAAPVLHLWHPEHERDRLLQNQEHLRHLLTSRDILAQDGLSKYLQTDKTAAKLA